MPCSRQSMSRGRYRFHRVDHEGYHDRNERLVAPCAPRSKAIKHTSKHLVPAPSWYVFDSVAQYHLRRTPCYFLGHVTHTPTSRHGARPVPFRTLVPVPTVTTIGEPILVAPYARSGPRPKPSTIRQTSTGYCDRPVAPYAGQYPLLRRPYATTVPDMA
eukprot:215285-Rhodomonas_salina.2